MVDQFKKVMKKQEEMQRVINIQKEDNQKVHEKYMKYRTMAIDLKGKLEQRS